MVLMVVCPECGKKLQILQGAENKAILCPVCRHAFVLSVNGSRAAAPAVPLPPAAAPRPGGKPSPSPAASATPRQRSGPHVPPPKVAPASPPPLPPQAVKPAPAPAPLPTRPDPLPRSPMGAGTKLGIVILLAAVAGIGGVGYWWYTGPSRWPAEQVYMPDENQILIVANLNSTGETNVLRHFQNTFNKQLVFPEKDGKLIDNPVVRWLHGELKRGNIRRVVVGRAPGRATELKSLEEWFSDQAVFVYQTKQPLPPRDLKEQQGGASFEAVRAGGGVLHRHLGTDMAYSVADARTVLVGPASVLRGILERNGPTRPSPGLHDALREAKLGGGLTALMDWSLMPRQASANGRKDGAPSGEARAVSWRVEGGEQLTLKTTVLCEDGVTPEKAKHIESAMSQFSRVPGVAFEARERTDEKNRVEILWSARRAPRPPGGEPEAKPNPDDDREPSVEELLPLLESEDPDRAKKGIEGLVKQGGDIVPELLKVLRDGRPSPAARNKRRNGAEVCARLGGDARAAVPELIELLRDGDESVRNAADGALRAVGRDARGDLLAALRKPGRPPGADPILRDVLTPPTPGDVALLIEL